MGKNTSIIFGLLGLAMITQLLGSCSTAAEIHGPDLFQEPAVLKHSDFYQGGAVSLPAMRQRIRQHAKLFLDVSNRESRIRSGASSYVLGSGLTALGLSITDEGTQDFYTILGLTSAAAVSGSQLYADRQRQLLLDEGAQTFNCFISATDPFLISWEKYEILFADSDPTSKQAAKLNALLSDGVLLEEARKIADREPLTGGLENQLRYQIVTSKHILVKAEASVRGLKERGNLSAEEIQVVEDAVSQLRLATASADSSRSKLIDYKAELDQAGSRLETAMRDVILVMTKELRRLEPSPDDAKTAFASIRAGLGATYESFNGSDFRSLIGGLAVPPPEDGNETLSKDPDRKDADELLKLLSLTLTKLDIVTGQVDDEMAYVDKKIELSKPIDTCDYPKTENTLIVSPAGTAFPIAAGGSLSFNVNVGGSATPNVTKLKDTDNILTIGAPTSAAGSGRYTIKVSSNKDVKSAAQIDVLITSDKTDRAIRKIISVAASKAPTIKSSSSDEIELVAGAAATDILIEISDESTPTLRALGKQAAQITIGEPQQDTKKKELYKVSLQADKAAEEGEVEIEVSAGFVPTTILLKAVIKPAPKPATPPTPLASNTSTPLALNKNESVVDLVKFLQSHLNETSSLSLAVNGQFDKATSDALKNLQKSLPSQFSDASGRVEDTTVKYLRGKMLEANMAAIDASWLSNPTLARKALQTLAKIESFAVNITDDNVFDLRERQVVWGVQYVLLRNGTGAANGIRLNGALDGKTIQYLQKK